VQKKHGAVCGQLAHDFRENRKWPWFNVPRDSSVLMIQRSSRF